MFFTSVNKIERRIYLKFCCFKFCVQLFYTDVQTMLYIYIYTIVMYNQLYRLSLYTLNLAQTRNI